MKDIQSFMPDVAKFYDIKFHGDEPKSNYLYPHELDAANKWFNKFNEATQKDLSAILGHLYSWCKSIEIEYYSDAIEKSRWYTSSNHVIGGYATLFAVGSTITKKKNPCDIDILLVTDRYVSANNKRGYEFPDLNKLLDAFGETHQVSIDDKISEKYDYETDCRIKIDLDSVSKKSKPIDLIWQWNIMSPERWVFNDKFKSMPLFRADNGHGPDQTYCKAGVGWVTLPPEYYKIKEK